MVDHNYQGDTRGDITVIPDMPIPTSAPSMPSPVMLSTANGRAINRSDFDIKKPDSMVAHPPHYNQGTMEAIDIIEAIGLGYHLSNSIKYLIRSPYKGNERQDLEKAIWYIQRYIEKNLPDESP